MSELYEQYGHLNQDELNAKLVEYSNYGDLEDVKYLLISPELKVHADIHVENDAALQWACYKNYLEMCKFFLVSPALKEHANIHVENDKPFRLALVHGRHDIIHYFIFDLNIPQTEHIVKMLEKNPDEQVVEWFKIREIKNKLTSELPNKEPQSRKSKI